MINKTIMATTALLASCALQPLMADPNLGRTIGLTCYGCHGYEGVSKGAVPSLKGLSESHVVTAMMAFKNGERQGTIMNRIAKGYTDEQIKALGKFVADL